MDVKHIATAAIACAIDIGLFCPVIGRSVNQEPEFIGSLLKVIVWI